MSLARARARTRKTDCCGLPLSVTVTPGQQHESTQVRPLLNGVSVGGKRGPRRRRLDFVSGDRAYDSQAIREELKGRGTEPVIPHRRRRNGTDAAESEDFDVDLYRERNVVERTIGRIKECRRIATRYEKTAANFVAMIHLAFIKCVLLNTA